MNDFTDNFETAILKKEGRATCDEKEVKCLQRNNCGAASITITRMGAKTNNGTDAVKYIYIDDNASKTDEHITATTKSGHYVFDNCNLTGYRCSEMTAMAISMLYGRPRKVGFIGTGKTNLLNAITVCKRFGIEEMVIRGSKRNLAKNMGEFMTVFDDVKVDASHDMNLLNKCDVVIECCNNCRKEELLSSDMLRGPKLIVALDCGFLLDESFRANRVSFADWPEQLENHYNEEFVFDKDFHSFHQMRYDHEPYEKGVVYLYGIAISDAVAAERVIKRIRKDGMENEFIVGKCRRSCLYVR